MTPYTAAKQCNEIPMRYHGRLGIVVADYPGEDLIEHLINQNFLAQDENEQIKDFLVTLNDKTNKCFQKTGMVRYNAFKDTGSNLSFALAILDRENNGIVLNGIYSRDTSNIYAKPVKAGKSEYKLSEEEEEAIDKAVRSKK